MPLETGTFQLLIGQRRRLVAVVLGLAAFVSMMGVLQEGAPNQPPGRIADPEGRSIERIEFKGLRTLDPVYLQGVAGIRAGSAWNRSEIAEACRRLAATQKFEGVPFAEPRDEQGRLVLVFVVQERPFLTSVDFVGNRKFSVSDLMKELDLEAGAPISEFLIRQAQQQIESKYKEAGYANVTVEFDPNILREERRVLFRISEGPRVKVKEIVFEGNSAFGDRRLKSLIETKTYMWLFRTGAYDPETAERDADAIRAFYVARGYLNAQVGHRIDFLEEEDDLTVTFLIEEGLQHIIKSVTYEGNAVFDDAELEGMMQSTLGEIVDTDVLKADQERIVREYGRQGYIYAQVSTSHVFDKEDGYVHLRVQVTEGGQFRVGRIKIRGNRHTKDKVVRRELRFFPEELYDTEAVKRAELRLTETRLFNEAKITPEGDQPGMRDALVTVDEADTTTIMFQAGLTSNSGVVGGISIEQRNFDLFDPPRTAGEFFRGRSFRGAGQTLRLQLEPGTDLTRARLEFREPYLFDREMGFGLGLYVFERGREDYDERRIGFTTSIDKRWRSGRLKGWAGEVAFRFENVNVSDADIFDAEDIRDAEGNNFLTSVKGTLVRDTTDSRWLPSEGDRLKLSVEQFGAFGGDDTFTKAIGTYDRYWTTRTDLFGRKSVFQVGSTIGHIFSDAPVFERFYAGGIGSLRGFEFRGISPREGIRESRIGGDFLLLANAQYSFPLVGQTVRGITFLDMGTVEDDFGLSDWRASVGFGVQIYVKFFGPIPLSFDLAAPIAKDSDDDTQIFSFSFGTTF